MGQIFKLNDDAAFNPLMKIPRNMKCPCGSGHKFKYCCLEITDPYIKKDELEIYTDTLKQALRGEKAW